MSLRAKLERQSEEEQKFIESEIIKISEKGKNIAINGLFIAGGLALSYLLFKYIVDDDEKPSKKAKPIIIKEDSSDEKSESMFGGITKAIAKEALLLLLALAKDRLTIYLNKDSESNEEHPSRTAK
ncbi:hypothetical protein [Fulvivirga lutimaris]|uniref:hypothetical protein n=1 Tax=Fulvivirga lutimaris TaxID=1819566 RepID=UPI0012BD6781|nr:hypothetical protein [Fulvivirga lutimaris]MTI38326.1 hypothetical protein [Fulvivirga lutimaris]